MSPTLRYQLHEIEHLMDDGLLEEAASSLQAFAVEYPETEEVFSLLGECYLCMGTPDLAIKPLRWALKCSERKAAKKKKTKDRLQPVSENEMILKIKKIMRRKRKDFRWVHHYLLGCSYARSMMLVSAIRHLNIANKLNPNDTEIVRNIGWIRCLQQKREVGRSLLQKSIDLDPENALAYNDIGASYMFEQNFREARKWIGKARELAPFDDFIHMTAEQLRELMTYKKILEKSKK